MTLIEDDEFPAPVTSNRGPSGRTHERPSMPSGVHRMPTPMQPVQAKPRR
jgi:hypothetical protein